MNKRSSSHITAQKRGKQRDKSTCQICGSKKNPEGHHIFDYAFGGAPDEDNIITLCHNCHTKAHNGLIDLFKF